MKNMKTNIAAIILLILFGLTSLTFAEEDKTNLEIVKSTYEGSTSEENGKNLRRFLADSAKWTEAAGFPYAGTYVGFNEIHKNVFQRLGTEWIDYRFTVEDYVAHKDKVVAYGTYSGIYRETQQYFEARVAHLWKLKDRKIVSFEQFVDSKQVIDAMVSSSN